MAPTTTAVASIPGTAPIMATATTAGTVHGMIHSGRTTAGRTLSRTSTVLRGVMDGAAIITPGTVLTMGGILMESPACMVEGIGTIICTRALFS